GEVVAGPRHGGVGDARGRARAPVHLGADEPLLNGVRHASRAGVEGDEVERLVYHVAYGRLAVRAGPARLVVESRERVLCRFTRRGLTWLRAGNLAGKQPRSRDRSAKNEQKKRDLRALAHLVFSSRVEPSPRLALRCMQSGN